MQYSVALRTDQASRYEAVIGTSAVLKIFDGAMPANVAAADAGTVLAALNLPSDYLANAAAGAVAKTGTWSDLSADAAGKARYFRFYQSDGTTRHIQGLVSMLWTASTPVTLNMQMHNGGNVYVVTTAGTTAASGGPSGTGTGIADGTAVWSYVGKVEMTVDTVNIILGQQFTVVDFTITQGNA